MAAAHFHGRSPRVDQRVCKSSSSSRAVKPLEAPLFCGQRVSVRFLSDNTPFLVSLGSSDQRCSLSVRFLFSSPVRLYVFLRFSVLLCFMCCCSACGESGELTCCDECPRVLHEGCHPLGTDSRLAAQHQTEGDPWYCPSCAAAGKVNLVTGVRYLPTPTSCGGAPFYKRSMSPAVRCKHCRVKTSPLRQPSDAFRLTLTKYYHCFCSISRTETPPGPLCLETSRRYQRGRRGIGRWSATETRNGKRSPARCCLCVAADDEPCCRSRLFPALLSRGFFSEVVAVPNNEARGGKRVNDIERTGKGRKKSKGPIKKSICSSRKRLMLTERAVRPRRRCFEVHTCIRH